METFTGSADLRRNLTIDLAVGLTFTQSTKGAARQVFGSEGGNTIFLSPGVIWGATEHFNFGAMFNYSPSSQLRADTSILYHPAPKETATRDAQVSAITSSWAGLASASYQTAGESNWETAVDVDVGVTHFSSEQRIVAARDASGKALGLARLKADIQAFCETAACTRQLVGLFREHGTPLNQVTVRVGVVETIHWNTDLGIRGTYYFYDRDPTDVGFYGLVAAGRGTSFGSGLPLAPLQWTLRPELVHRWSRFSMRVWFEHGLYVDSEGVMDVAGSKLEYKLTRDLRLWLTASVQRDRDTEGIVTLFGQGSLGAMFRF